MSCISAGGTVRLTVNGTVYAVRGSVTINPTAEERTEGANLDGSPYYTSKPVVPSVEMTLSDQVGLDIGALSGTACGDATIDLDEVERTYIVVNATVVGRASLNPESGEWSGLKLIGSEIRTING
ncbi:phage tail tube protein [Sulfitobacter sp. 1A15106]|uniref:phage tail tube protein n=1 Tax=Sulfitobacter sp. 1A15106 TaxID=3368590 RepID=UPI0037452AFB